MMVASGGLLRADAGDATWLDGQDQDRQRPLADKETLDTSFQERIRSGLAASTRSPSQVLESVKLLGAGGLAGAFSKSCTAPLARLTILYQVMKCEDPINSIST